MLKNLKLLILLSILLFTLGFVLSLGKQKKPTNYPRGHYDNNEERVESEYEDISIDENNPHASIGNNLTIIRDDKEDDKKDDPDGKYYEKARALEKAFPNYFIMNSSTHKKTLALTFDDGPDVKTTPQILDILKEHNIPATFFIIGQNGNQNPKVLKRMIDEGHQVANHSWSHLRPTELNYREFLLETSSTQDFLEDYIGSSSPFYYRPPYGLLEPDHIKQIGNNGYLIISWSIDSLDWNTTSPLEIKHKVIDSIHPGAIVLMHCAGGPDARLGTVKALPEIIESLTQQGYEFLTVDNLLNNQ